MKLLILKQLITAMTALLALLTSQPQLGAKLGAIYQEVPAVQETKIGDFAYFTFRNNQTGEIKKVNTTKAEYDKLALKDAVNPTLDGYTFIGASSGPIIATSTPILQDNQYYKVGVDVASTTLIKLKLPNQSASVIPITQLNFTSE